MTNEEQNIAVAELVGWKKTKDSWISPTGSSNSRFRSDEFGLTNAKIPDEDIIPNYGEDLNAMHEAEKKLSMGQLVEYGKHLNRMDLKYNYGYVETVISSTASQRREALLRTIGKYKEQKQ